MSYQIFTDATADLSEGMLKGLPRLEIIPMQVTVGEREYTYGPNGDIDVATFYRLLREGEFASTSQINPDTYMQSFEPYLQQGTDILYLCFSSGLSGTIQSARLAIEDLKELYPQQKVVCVDTLCGSVGQAFLVHEALKQQRKGLSLQELFVWVEEHKRNVCHWFTVDTFEHLKHGGRVSSAAAMMGTVLQIKPMLRINDMGALEVCAKPRGRKKAVNAQVEKLLKDWQPELGTTIVVGHGDDPDGAEYLCNAVKNIFTETEIYVAEIGPIIGAHTGPGMLALIYWGNNR